MSSSATVAFKATLRGTLLTSSRAATVCAYAPVLAASKGTRSTRHPPERGGGASIATRELAQILPAVPIWLPTSIRQLTTEAGQRNARHGNSDDALIAIWVHKL